MLDSAPSFRRFLQFHGIDDWHLNVSVRDRAVADSNIEILSSDWARSDFAVKLVPEYSVAVVWDCAIRRVHGGPNGCYLSNSDFLSVNPGPSCFSDVYKELRPGGRHTGYEKVMVVGASHFDRFFANMSEFMEKNPYDACFLPRSGRLALDEPSSRVAVRQNEQSDINAVMPRKRYSTSYFARKSGFREKVLNSYGCKCVICRLDIEEALEATHKHGREVAEGSYFDVDDGVCLCRNHHRMYDRSMFDIDFEAGRLVDVDDRIKQSKWYQRFFDDFGGVIERQVL